MSCFKCPDGTRYISHRTPAGGDWREPGPFGGNIRRITPDSSPSEHTASGPAAAGGDIKLVGNNRDLEIAAIPQEIWIIRRPLSRQTAQ